MGDPGMSISWSMAGDALAAWIRAYVAQYPGALLSAARSRKSVAGTLLREALSQPFAQAILRVYAPSVRALTMYNVDAVADRVVTSLRSDLGEAGQIARTYPDWIRGEIRILAHEVGRLGV